MKYRLASLAALATLSACSTPKKQPNVILIMTDQHRFDYLGSVNPEIQTPHLDALAGDGVRFANAYSSTPSSTPARSALLTGQAPWHHGMIGYHSQVAPEFPVELPQLMTDAGYYSYGIGKMHWHPQRALHGFAATELDESGRVEADDFISDYRQWFAQTAPGLNPDSTGIGWNDHAAGAYTLPEELHPTRWTGDQAVRFIENYDLEEPLFLKVSFARPHSPYDPPERFLDMYENVTLPAPVIGDWAQPFSDNYSHDPKHQADAAFGDFGSEYAQKSRKYYAANVTFLDEEIGRIITALKKQGLYDNSVILFVSDHGDMLGDHHHWRKTYPFEGSAAVPFIVRYPSGMKTQVKRGSVRDELVEIRDILPTFVEAAGGEIPESVDGQSILRLLEDPATADWRAVLDLEHSAAYGPNNGWVGLTDGRYKYAWYYSKGEEMLFDLRNDPYELKEIHHQQPEITERFRKLMAQHLAERGESWVKDGELQVIKNVSVLTPNYPKRTEK